MQQRMPRFQAEGSNQTINRLAHREPHLAQAPLILRGGHCHICSAGLEDFEVFQRATHLSKGRVIPNPLQHVTEKYMSLSPSR